MKKLLPHALRQELGQLENIAIAYSGGLDSRFLCHAAQLCGCQVQAWHVTGPHLPLRDTGHARSWANRRQLKYLETEVNVLQLPEVSQNTLQRCYACKKAIFSVLKKRLACQNSSAVLCDGSNADDGKSFRPGLQALRELGIVSPLALAGLDKQSIRELAARTGLEEPGQQARPCLLTRFKYGVGPTRELLQKIEKTENGLQDVLGPDVEFRLRLMPEPVLHLAREPGKLKAAILAVLEKNGFCNIPLQICEKISGFFDTSAGKPVLWTLDRG